MTTLVETFTWAAYETQLKAEFGITDASQDSKLRRELRLAALGGDAYIGCRWPGDTPIPTDDLDTLFGGIIAYIDKLRATEGMTDGLRSVKTGDLSETYGRDVNTARSALSAAATWWCTYQTGKALFRTSL